MTYSIVPKSVQTMEDVYAFIDFVTRVLGGGFHPDTDFTDYIARTNNGTTHRIFNERVAARYNKMLDQAFNICNHADVDIYKIAIDMFRKQELRLKLGLAMEAEKQKREE